MSSPFTHSDLGLVVIGRNEGKRLERCLVSIGNAAPVVYVDSGSCDDSIAVARAAGAIVVELSMSMPFTAGRARNAGFTRLTEAVSAVRFVQFLDGDCELRFSWLSAGREFLTASDMHAVVCGSLEERNPHGSLYNRLCSLEWKGKPGDTQACGGIFMVRREAFEAVGGFNEGLIAGEEPELCFRLREAGWLLRRVDGPMALHDAAMTRFGQWWRRAVRSGHAYAERAWLHRRASARPWRRELYRDWFWSLLIPFAAFVGAYPSGGVSLLLLGIYPVGLWRIIAFRRRGLEDSVHDAVIYSLFCMLGKFPSVIGQILFHWRRFRRRQTSLIEYKSAVDSKV